MENFKPVIEELEKRRSEANDKKVDRSLCGMTQLIKALEQRDLPPSAINEELKKLKNILSSELSAKAINGLYRTIVNKILKEHKLVTPKYYQNLWMVLGMTAFGMPIGVLVFTMTGNAAFISIGLPIGMPIGMAIGMQMDKKAREEGRALVFEGEPAAY